MPLANETYQKRQIDSSDSTGTSKLLLWEESCKQPLESGVTYIFSVLRLTVRGRCRYLNSPKMGTSPITQTDGYQKEVQESFSPICFTKTTQLNW